MPKSSSGLEMSRNAVVTQVQRSTLGVQMSLRNRPVSDQRKIRDAHARSTQAQNRIDELRQQRFNTPYLSQEQKNSLDRQISRAVDDFEELRQALMTLTGANRH